MASIKIPIELEGYERFTRQLVDLRKTIEEVTAAADELRTRLNRLPWYIRFYIRIGSFIEHIFSSDDSLFATGGIVQPTNKYVVGEPVISESWPLKPAHGFGGWPAPPLSFACEYCKLWNMNEEQMQKHLDTDNHKTKVKEVIDRNNHYACQRIGWNPNSCPRCGTLNTVTYMGMEVCVACELPKGEWPGALENLGHKQCPCWATGKFKRVDICKDHPWDL